MQDRLVEIVNINKNSSHSKTNEVRYVPLQFHVVGDNEGLGYISTDKILKEICTLNENFESVDIKFYIKTPFTFINDSRLLNHAASYQVYEIMNQYKINNVINIFIVDVIGGNASGGGAEVGGYYAPTIDIIAVRQRLLGANMHTLTHEIGHFLSLPHPFSTYNGIELVNGSNCDDAGDFFCDTRADFQNYPWGCDYTDTMKDPNGDPYDPDPSLYMSYSHDGCASRFSQEQINAMNTYLTYYHSDLLQITELNASTPEAVSLIYPENNSTDVTYNTILEWNTSAEAELYHLIVSKNATFNLIVADIVTSDTISKVTLEPGQRYFWKVKPMVSGNLCSPYSILKKFTTNEDPGEVFSGIGDGIRNSAFEAQLFPNPATDHTTIILKNASSSASQIIVYDILGQIIKKYDFDSDRLVMDTKDMATGQYIINITQGTSTIRKKLSVQ